MAQSEAVPATSHHTDTWVAGASGELRVPQVWEAELCRQTSRAQGGQRAAAQGSSCGSECLGVSSEIPWPQASTAV